MPESLKIMAVCVCGGGGGGGGGGVCTLHSRLMAAVVGREIPSLLIKSHSSHLTTKCMFL